ncbi:nuclease-related domain-containing protein [Bacillus sp. EAC]|uniref:nuclease-related domain-containing protein n=1 Tax=Bacillus sp. EAC TaxID=1978338 RepID=UPI000B43B215|nr:nuclease-related domain-containing protein [Bacillus sp. EAC]
MFSKLIGIFTGKNNVKNTQEKKVSRETKNKIQPTRIGELGEYKINIQLDQLNKKYKYISDLLIGNPKSKSGYSQIDHVVFTHLGIFVIETKNYQGTIYGDRKRSTWNVNGKFKMMNPFHQNFGHIKAINALLDNVDLSSYISIVSFSRRCIFKVNEELRKIHSNDLIVYDTELTDYINRKLNVLKLQPQLNSFTDEEILMMFNKLNGKNILDPEIRQKHIELINEVKSEESNESKIYSATCATCGKKVSEKVKD